MKVELFEKNQELKDLVEGEKKSLRDKVHEEIERHLQAAIQAKLAIEKLYDAAKMSLTERDMLFEELDHQYMVIR